MLFNTLSYWGFLIVIFIGYWLLNKHSNLTIRNLFILMASYYFYGSWDERFLLLIIASSIVDFIAGGQIFRSNRKTRKRFWLIVSLTFNLGMLGFFKYYNFFIDSFIDFIALFGLTGSRQTLSIILPVGISFYTFQTLSYTLDIYRGRLTPTKSLVSFFTFVAFFPQLVAGPIERASQLLPQINRKQRFDLDQAISGLRYILWGLFKKVVIADRLAYFVEQVYSSPDGYNGAVQLIAAVFFGLQIYCDFSGYSDIAIGSARLLGIGLMDNFKTPYFSSSLREFWQRWHISLSTWFRDYIYIPLGGNRKGKWLSHLFLIVTFMISGLWHGANYTFIVWGFLHGFIMVLEREGKHMLSRIPQLVSVPFTFIIVTLCWIFFRALNIDQATSSIVDILTFDKAGKNVLEFFREADREYFISVLAGMLVFIPIEVFIGKTDVNRFMGSVPRLLRYVLYYVIIAMLLIFGVLDTAPQFIYFQF